jgi:hypothetical protein
MKSIKMNRRTLIGGTVLFLVGELLFKNSRQTVANAQNEVVRVTTIEDFFRAIRSNRTMQLETGTYSLTDLSPSIRQENAYFEEIYDGYELVISNVENFKIVGLGNQPARLLTSPRYGEVIRFRNCNHISLENIEAGHGPEKGICSGGVFNFSESQDININQCILFGSGTAGLRAYNVKNLNCKNTVIKDCTYHILVLADSENIQFKECQFTNNREYNLVNVRNSQAITFKKCLFQGNFSIEYSSLFCVQESRPIELIDCKIEDNKVGYFASNNELVKLINTQLQNNQFREQGTLDANCWTLD